MRTIPQNKQEYLDLLVKTSREGGFPALNADGDACVYRTEDGRACAAGVLIPDEKYSPDMETRSADKLGGGVFPDWIGDHELRFIQSEHDNLAFSVGWSHWRFVSHLNRCSAFANMAPTGGWEAAREAGVSV